MLKTQKNKIYMMFKGFGDNYGGPCKGNAPYIQSCDLLIIKSNMHGHTSYTESFRINVRTVSLLTTVNDF